MAIVDSIPYASTAVVWIRTLPGPRIGTWGTRSCVNTQLENAVKRGSNDRCACGAIEIAISLVNKMDSCDCHALLPCRWAVGVMDVTLVDGIERGEGPSVLHEVVFRELVQCKRNGAVGVDRSLHVAVDGGQGALAGILGQLVSMGAGNTDDPAGNHLVLPAPIRRFVDVRRVVVRVAGDQIHVLADHDGSDVGIRREIAVEHCAQPCQLSVRKLSWAGVVEGDEVDAIASPVIPGANGSSSRAVSLALGCNLRTVEILREFLDVALARHGCDGVVIASAEKYRNRAESRQLVHPEVVPRLLPV